MMPPLQFPLPSTSSLLPSLLSRVVSFLSLLTPPLSTMLDEIAPHEEAPVVRHCLDEFMDQPSCVFQKPDVLRAVLGCLPFRDLQMVLAYVVRQHSDAMARAEEGA